MRHPVLLVLLLSLLPACDVYTSAVPLTPPGEAPFDEALLGTWAVAEEPDGDSVVVLRAGDHSYLVQVSVADEIETGLAHVTVIRGVHFLNVFDHHDSTYSFVRYLVAGDTLRFRLMSGASAGPDARSPFAAGNNVDRAARAPLLGQYRDSDSLRAAVLQHMNEPRLFDDEEGALRLRHRPGETFCVDYDVLTATNNGPGQMKIWRVAGIHPQGDQPVAIPYRQQTLLATLEPGTHYVKVPYVPGGTYAFASESGSRLRVGCR